MAKVALDGGPSSAEKRGVRDTRGTSPTDECHRKRELASCQNGWKGARQCRILGHG
jgi:hypothetical protein